MIRLDFRSSNFWGAVILLQGVTFLMWRGWWEALAVYSVILMLIVAFVIRKDKAAKKSSKN